MPLVEAQLKVALRATSSTKIFIRSIGSNVGWRLTGPPPALPFPSAAVVAGLVVGKQLGITLFAWLAVKSGLAEMPPGVGWSQVYGVGWLPGIGFTMSLFIADLAFEEDPLLDVAKLPILAASLIAGIVGWVILRGVSSSPSSSG